MNRMHPSSLGGSVKAAASAVVIALLACGAAPAHAADAQGGIPGEWLMNYAGARTLGLGGAFVATADDALGILWNPAGLQAMEQNQLMFENVHLFEDTQMNSFGFALPGSRLPSFGLSIVSLQSGDFERTNELNDNLGSFHEGETAYLFTMAKNLTPRLSLGTNFKLEQQTVEDFSSNGFGIDLGAIYQFTPNLRIGATMLNIAGPSITLRDTPENYPMQVRGGFALKVLNGRGLVSAQIDKYPATTEVVWCQEEPMNQGAWYQIQHHLLACIGDQHSLHYAGRVRSPAPAAGHSNTHIAEQAALVEQALIAAPGFNHAAE